MTHEMLITELSQRLGWTEQKVAETLETAITVMNTKLAESKPLSLPNLGDFITRRKTEYISVHPATKERWLIPPAIELLFEVAPELKEQLINNVKV